MIQNLINHIAFVVDASGSMQGIAEEVIRVFDTQVAYLAKRSQELNQETRVSVYLFNNTTTCLIYDMDVMRLPSLKGHYGPDGWTALIDGTLKSISDLRLMPELYSDHAFLIYAITDGVENKSKNSPTHLSQTIRDLPENWTVAVLVPDQTGVFEAKKFGFPADNISIWDATSTKGMQEAGRCIRESTDNFFNGRAKGIRGTKTLFKLNVNVTAKEIKKALTELSDKEYTVIKISKKCKIKDAVENKLGKYLAGTAYYQLVKTEEVQANKKICIVEKASGKVYSGQNARDLLGLPIDKCKVKPGDFGKFDIFIQSTSWTRILLPDSLVIVLK